MNFSRNINPVSSCGDYVGRYQYKIETELVKRILDGAEKSDDTVLSEILNEMGILDMCRRNTIMISPIISLRKTENHMNIILDNKVISMRIDRVGVGIPNPEF